ncbi:MAG: hypothetical protein KA257_00080 [Opitutaceae bacterium]|nr:hypothetical protein [Opitutaceae bacterium]
MSLLLRREPFGMILEETLSGYWSHGRTTPVQVRWAKPAPGHQVWHGNIYLNFFCIEEVDPACFDVIVREFSYARSRWRRGLQAAYVRAAVTPPTRGWLSQVCFDVSSPVPAAAGQLVIGGNRRLRIIHPSAGRSIVIPKAHFSRQSFDREVAARQGAAAALAPRFDGVEAGGGAFAEEYFAGTPANRLPPAREAQVRAEARSRLVAEVHQPTLRVAILAEHLGALEAACATLAPGLAVEARALAAWAAQLAGHAPVGLALSHGDFQDANILVAGDRLRVIDWETAAERTQLYDLATHASGLRLAGDAGAAWRAEVTRWLIAETNMPALLVPVENRAIRMAHAAAWWLEESLLRLEEARAAFHELNRGAGADVAVKQGLGEALVFLSRFES